MKKYFLPRDYSGKIQFVKNYVTKLPLYQKTFSISDEDMAQAVIDQQNISSIQDTIDAFRKYGIQLTTYRNMLLNGDSTGGPVGTLSAAPQIPVINGNPILGDMLGRISNQIKTIKAHGNYNEAIGHDLGIIGEETTPTDYANVQPIIGYNMQAGHPNITWKKDGFQGINIYVDRGDGKGYGERPYIDTKPDYLDTYDLPASGESIVWKYKAIYLEDDEEVGQMSNELAITTMGKL